MPSLGFDPDLLPPTTYLQALNCQNHVFSKIWLPPRTPRKAPSAIRLRPGPNEQMSETDLQASYRPQKLCTWSKNHQGIRFWHQKSSSSSKIDRNWRKTQETRRLKNFKFQILILPRLGPRPCRAVPPSGRAPALAKLKFAKFFERTNDETELQESYRPKKLCTWSKIGQGIRFWRQKSPSSSKIDRKSRKTSFRHRKFSSKKIGCVKKSKVANRLKHVLPKFRTDWGFVRNGRLKFPKH